MQTVDVLVLDAEDRVLTPCSPARARVLVNDGQATWASNNPPTIRLSRWVSLGRKRDVMPITNWTEYFREERDIYVQNVANAQVSLEFEIAPGIIQSHLFTHTRNPVNLTQHIPFHSIRNSVNFRKMLNRRPPVLQLLTEEEFTAYYNRKANEWKVSPEEAIDRAEEQRQGVAQHRKMETNETPTPIHEVVEDGKRIGEKKIVRSAEIISSDEIINPRVLHLCNQVSSLIAEKDKMRAADMLEELERVEEQLKLDDYEYLRAHGYWKTIKAWAQSRAAKFAASDIDGDG